MVHPAIGLRIVAHARQSLAIPEPLPHIMSSSPSWHPKISPYRFILITSTVALGTAKAVLTQRGSTVAPITLEWLTGTLIFLLSFSISAYDNREDTVPPVLSWLFKPDCMDYLWSFLASYTDMNFPLYDSGEKATIWDPHRKHPPITPYRILVCSAVTLFGMSKAILGYYGLSTAMTWADWALAVPVTTFLYVLGLYEYNSSNMWSSFFAADYSQIFCFISAAGVQYTAWVLYYSAWCLGWAYMLWHSNHDPDWGIRTSRSRPDNYQVTFRTRIEDMSNFATKLFSQTLILLMILAGLMALLSEVAAQGGLVRRALCTVRRLILLMVTKFLPSLAEDRQWTRSSSLSLLRRHCENFIGSIYFLFQLFAWVFVCVFLLAFWLSFGISVLGVIVLIFDVCFWGVYKNPECSARMQSTSFT